MKTVKPADAETLAKLRTPESLEVLGLLQANGWLTADVPEVKTFFSADDSHPAREVLMNEAAFGGLAGYLQVAFLLGFLAIAIILTSFQSNMPSMLFALWVTLGVSLGLLLRRHPGYLGWLGKRARK